MTGFMDWVFGRSNRGSSQTAKERLRFVLVHDRINLPPEKLAMLKADILTVISRYVEVDMDSVDIALQQLDRSNSKIVAEIPFTGAGVSLQANLDEDADLRAETHTAADPSPVEAPVPAEKSAKADEKAPD
jgi:cell division topological specificity factor